MKRSATSASRRVERITSGSTTYRSSARHFRTAQRDLTNSSISSQHCRRRSISSRPSPATSVRASATFRSSTRIYSTVPNAPPQSSHFREDIHDSSLPPTRPKTHYEFFPKSLASGPPPTGPFTLDLSALKREFLQLQALAHPDKHSGANKARAEALSSAINEAYKTLQDPLRRANYLLELGGVESEECDKLGGEFVGVGHGQLHRNGGEAGQDMELLMEVMEAREAVEEAETEDEVGKLVEENDQRVNASIQVLEEAFEDNDLVKAKRESVRLRYWRNIGESLREWEGKGSEHILQH